MPIARSVTIEDPDRGLDLVLDVTYSYRPASRDGRITPGEAAAVDVEAVELAEGTVWFGDVGLAIRTSSNDAKHDEIVCRRIVEKYRPETEAKILERIKAAREVA